MRCRDFWSANSFMYPMQDHGITHWRISSDRWACILSNRWNQTRYKRNVIRGAWWTTLWHDTRYSKFILCQLRNSCALYNNVPNKYKWQTMSMSCSKKKNGSIDRHCPANTLNICEQNTCYRWRTETWRMKRDRQTCAGKQIRAIGESDSDVCNFWTQVQHFITSEL